MSQEQPLEGGTLAAGRPPRVRFDRLKRSQALNVLGVPELIGLAAALVLALFTLFAYFYFMIPAQLRQKSLQDERVLVQAQVKGLQGNIGVDTTAHNAVDRIQKSLEDFESNRLAVSGTGRMSLYSELNDLMRSNGLRNTAGPSYSTLPPLGTKMVQSAASTGQQSSAKWQTIYPGIAVTVTVEGAYQNIRHFVRDLETNREFLIINAVELEGVTQSGAAQDLAAPLAGPGRSAAPGTAPSGTRSTMVSLRLDLATYFQRSAANAPASSTPAGN